MSSKQIFNINDYRKFKQVVKDIPTIISILQQTEKSLEKFKHYSSANEVLFYSKVNIEILKAQLLFYSKKLDQIRKGPNEQ